MLHKKKNSFAEFETVKEFQDVAEYLHSIAYSYRGTWVGADHNNAHHFWMQSGQVVDPSTFPNTYFGSNRITLYMREGYDCPASPYALLKTASWNINGKALCEQFP